MVSGVETAGLVLASLPLVIVLLQHYRAGLEPVLGVIRFRNEHRLFVEEMERQVQLYRNHLEYLLVRIGTEPPALDALLEQPAGEKWKDPRLEQQLRAFLEGLYGSFCSTVAEVESALEQLLKMKLSDAVASHTTGAAQKPPLDSKHHTRRLHFTLSKQKRDKLVGSLQKYNTWLGEALTSSSNLAPSRQKRRRPPLFATAVLHVRERAAAVHTAIAGSWRCKCSAAHAASLLLEKHVGPNDAPETTDSAAVPRQQPPAAERPSGPCFNILFRFSADSWDSERQDRPWAWHETNIAVAVPQDASDVLQNGSTKDAPPSPDTASRTRTMHKKGKWVSALARSAGSAAGVRMEQKLRFTIPAPEGVELTSLTTAATDVVHCLCSAIKVAQDGPPLKGLIRAHNGDSLKVFPASPSTPCLWRQKFVSLDTLLHKSASFGAEPLQFSLRQRYRSALVLATSLLQLYATPWLSAALDKTEIFYRVETRNHLYSHRGVVGGPYLVSTFAPSPPQQAMEAGASCRDGYSVHAPTTREVSERRLHRLGIILLELVHGRAVETHPLHLSLSGRETPKELADLATATMWCKRVAEEAGDEFHRAITRCIDCNFGQAKVDLADSKFMAEFGEEVVMQLDLALSRIWGPE